MLEPSNQASLQRRANWVALRTLRQRPKLVGETPDGEQVYEVRSARLVLRGLSPHFDQLAPCARCGKEVPAAPVMTITDLDRPLRPVICTGCIKGTGVFTAWEPPAAEVQAEPAAQAGPAAAPDLPVEPAPGEAVAAAAEPVAAAEAATEDDRLEVFERHLRVVTDRVNELGKSLWALGQADHERGREDEAARSVVAGVGDRVDAQRAELAAVTSAVADLRTELDRLSAADRDMTPLVAAHQALEQRVAEAEARAMAPPPPLAPSDVEAIVAGRMAEVEARLADQMADQMAGQRAAPEKAVEASARTHADGLRRAHDELASGQAAVAQRLDTLVAQVAQATIRMDAMASWVASTNDRLDAVEERAERALVAGAPRLEVPQWEAPDDMTGESGSLLQTLERQLEDAADRLAARSSRGPAEEPGRGF